VDESDSYADILNLLKAGILKYDSKPNHVQLLKTMSRCLHKVPLTATKDVIKHLVSGLQE
jgi:hypothetical protein